jgi:putative ABC transport system permease protein
MFKLVLAYLRSRPWMTGLNLLLVSVSVAMISLLIQVNAQIQDKLLSEARGIDMVVGGKGSPLQLVLAGVYHLDIPPGNIPLASFQTLSKNRFVAQAIPLSLGDSYRGFRIVGTQASLLEHYRTQFAQGAWNAAANHAVVGATVAAKAQLSVGSRFASTHGLVDGGTVHADHILTVTGILKPSGTVLDRLILTELESIWLAHEGHAQDKEEKEALLAEREITLGLIRYASPLAAATLPRQVNASTDMQAASPAIESARLFQVLGPALSALTAFAFALLAMAALSIFVAISQALADRRQELAMLRLMGASKGKLFSMLCLEGILLAIGGLLLGLALSHLALAAMNHFFGQRGEWSFNPLLWHPMETALLICGIIVGALAAAWPAWRATRLQTQDLLNELG